VTKLILFNKPFNVLSQFTDKSSHASSRKTLSDFINVANVYAAGRLDKDSEGLLVLTDNGALQAKISDPKYNTSKSYWVQVEGVPDESMLAQLRHGLRLKDGLTRPAVVTRIDPPSRLWPRNPAVRFRKTVPDSWLDYYNFRRAKPSGAADDRCHRHAHTATDPPPGGVVGLRRSGQWSLA